MRASKSKPVDIASQAATVLEQLNSLEREGALDAKTAQAVFAPLVGTDQFEPLAKALTSKLAGQSNTVVAAVTFAQHSHEAISSARRAPSRRAAELRETATAHEATLRSALKDLSALEHEHKTVLGKLRDIDASWKAEYVSKHWHPPVEHGRRLMRAFIDGEVANLTRAIDRAHPTGIVSTLPYELRAAELPKEGKPEQLRSVHLDLLKRLESEMADFPRKHRKTVEALIETYKEINTIETTLPASGAQLDQRLRSKSRKKDETRIRALTEWLKACLR